MSVLLFRVGPKGAVVRSGADLSSPKVGRLLARSEVRVLRQVTINGLMRVEVTEGWVSQWVLWHADDGAEPESWNHFPLSPVMGCADQWRFAERGGSTSPPRCGGPLRCGGYEVRSDFCSGSLGAVRLAADGAVELRSDCTLEKEKEWFFFRVKRSAGDSVATFRWFAPLRLKSLFWHGYRPVARRQGPWQRLASDAFSYRPVTDKDDPDDSERRSDLPTTQESQEEDRGESKEKKEVALELQWTWTFGGEDDFAEFAFCYPYSYEKLREKLDQYEATSEVFMRRETLTTSLLGRPVELLTISDAVSEEASIDGIYFSEDGKATFAWPPSESEDPIAGGEKEESHRCRRVPFRVLPHRQKKEAASLKNKKEVIVCARVHPGETPSSFVIDGLLELLLDPKDAVARDLRQQYTFRVLPMLNPDGVALGLFRVDSRGDDLNRHYGPETDGSKHPAQAALIALARSLYPNLFLVVDCHAHANKRGCFLFGNKGQSPQDDVETQLLAALLSARCPNFEFESSDFKRSNPGSARVALERLLCDKSPRARVYTLECNYNSGKPMTKDQPPHAPTQRLIKPYTPGTWHDLGRALGRAILDLAEENQMVDEARSWLQARLLDNSPNK